MMKKIK